MDFYQQESGVDVYMIMGRQKENESRRNEQIFRGCFG